MKKPNIIFILSDQQRWDTLGCYGQKSPTTANLDEMAGEGVRFENAFTCQPVCGPARASIQTGKYATEVDCFRNYLALPQEEKTLAHYLSEAGYEVGYLGKWHLASSSDLKDNVIDYRIKPVPPELRGGYKDYWLVADALEESSHSYDGYMFNGDMEKVCFPEGAYRVDAETDWAIDYLRSRDGEKPFFFFVSFLEPHHQNDHNCYEGPKGSKERFGNYEIPGDLAGTEGDWRENWPDYLGCVNSLDENVGRIRGELERLGLAENTIIIYTSDHGSHFRTRNSEYKRSCHDGCIRIPMIVYGPGFKGGKVIDELVSLIDLAPTVLTEAGVEVPDHMQGRALQELITGEAKDWPEEVFVQISESQIGRAIRTKKWKYSVTVPSDDPRLLGRTFADSDTYTEDFLYDLENDPHEKNNLVRSKDHVEIRAELAEILKEKMKQAGEKPPVIVPASDMECETK